MLAGMPVSIVTNAYEDPRLRASLFALYDTVWGFLRAKEALAAGLGFPWRQISTPFAAVDGGRVVAHAGLLGVPMVVAGRALTVGAIHAVCVAEELRGQGLGRRVLTAALAAADERYPAVVLASEKETLYAKFGFQPRALHVFVAHGVAGDGGARRLDLGRADDAALWVGMMRARGAVSDRFAVLDGGAVNAFDAVNRDGSHAPLWADDRLGVVYYARRDGGRVVIDDVFAAGPFDGEALLAGLALAGDEVVFGCDPELLGLETRVEIVPYSVKDDRLMIRGVLVDDEVPVAWPAYSFT
jgi:ribosomal protein S18 acetylase RimI-like enzyme